MKLNIENTDASGFRWRLPSFGSCVPATLCRSPAGALSGCRYIAGILGGRFVKKVRQRIYP